MAGRKSRLLMLAIWILAVRLVRSIFKKTHLALCRVQFFSTSIRFTEHQSEQKRDDEEGFHPNSTTTVAV